MSSNQRHSLTTYVQKTLMQFLPSMGNKTTTTSTSSQTNATTKQKSTQPHKPTPAKNNAKVKRIVSSSESSGSDESSYDEDDSDSDASSSSEEDSESDSSDRKSPKSSSTTKKKSKQKPKPRATPKAKKKSPVKQESRSRSRSPAATAKKKPTSASKAASASSSAKSKLSSSSAKKSASGKKAPKSKARPASPVDCDAMSDVSGSGSSSSSSALVIPSSSSSSSKPKANGKKRKMIRDSDEEEDDPFAPVTTSHRAATPPLPPTSRLHSNATPLPSPISSDDEADIEPDRRTPSKVKHIDQVQIGKYELTTWYHSPYPDPYRTAKKLFVCEFCLKYCKEYKSMAAHEKECAMRKPPGKLIYHDGVNSVFEVDGSKHKLYCQCLTLFAKLFIDHKTLYFDVDPFLFYILTESVPASSSHSSHAPSSPSSSSNTAHQVVAYFSKEKQSPDQFNVSCILTFPQYQRKGYGKFLIALSYELSRREKRIGSPEKPLSELGKVSYRSYWINELLSLLTDPKNQHLTILDICNLTSIKKEDVISSLESVQLIKYLDGEHHLDCTSKHSKEVLAKHKQKMQVQAKASAAAGLLDFKPEKLHWKADLSTISSPSVAFPEPSSPATSARKLSSSSTSQAKKRIKL